ncbi:MAG: 2-amino-4-hydroxy-6-hydroxymethyldihydropteridine diphosphokinase [Gammaproteobacteria bacterium]
MDSVDNANRRPAAPVRAYVGLGSNQADPVRQVRAALTDLAGLPRTALVVRSSLYRSAPMGPPDQPDYVNAVAGLDSGLSALELLHALQAIETAHGRVRSGERWGPRTLDLDLLLYDEARFDSPELTVPHPGLHRRAFVLYPLGEIAAELSIPGQGKLATLLARVSPEGLERVQDHDQL